MERVFGCSLSELILYSSLNQPYSKTISKPDCLPIRNIIIILCLQRNIRNNNRIDVLTLHPHLPPFSIVNNDTLLPIPPLIDPSQIRSQRPRQDSRKDITNQNGPKRRGINRRLLRLEKLRSGNISRTIRNEHHRRHGLLFGDALVVCLYERHYQRQDSGPCFE